MRQYVANLSEGESMIASIELLVHNSLFDAIDWVTGCEL